MGGNQSIASLGAPGSFTDYSSYMMYPYMNQYSMMNPYMMHPYMMNNEYMQDPVNYMINFKKRMTEAEHAMEKDKLNHATDIHAAQQHADVQNLAIHDRTYFEKAMVDDDVNTSIRNLAEVIRAGDTRAICEEFEKVQKVLLTKYGDYFRTADGGKNVTAKVQGFISDLYSKKVEAWNGGAPADLRKDIRDYGESALMWGFNKNYFGKQDYHDMYTEQTMNYLFGTRIDNKRGKDRMAEVGGYLGRGAEALTTIPMGMAGGAAAGGGLIGLAKLFTAGHAFKNAFRFAGEEQVKDAAGKVIKDAAGNPLMRKISAGAFWKATKWGAALGALAAFAGDIWWQNTRSA